MRSEEDELRAIIPAPRDMMKVLAIWTFYPVLADIAEGMLRGLFGL